MTSPGREPNAFSVPEVDNRIVLSMLDAQSQASDPWTDSVQPKLDIGNYVADCGVRVPKRYDDFENASAVVANGGRVIARSEHAQEYSQFSGLLESVVLDAEIVDLAKMFSGFGMLMVHALPMADDRKGWTNKIERYLRLTSQDKDAFYDGATYSYWEYIPGTNITVVADDIVEGRYHLFGTTSGTDEFALHASVLDSDGYEEEHFTALHEETKKRLIDTYEKIRNLAGLPSGQCPVMEFQVDEDSDIWFLQYHKARATGVDNGRLAEKDYPPEDGWHRADAVRGALGAFVTLKTALWYPGTVDEDRQPNFRPPTPEDASFDFHYDVGLTEYLARRRVLFLAEKSPSAVYMGLAEGGHVPRSQWFKPNCALALGKNSLASIVPREVQKEVARTALGEDRLTYVSLDAASDGRTAFVRYSPDHEETV